MDDGTRNLRFTLEEIERLLAMANRIGVPVEPWVEELAIELRANRTTAAQEGADMAGRMRSDPGRSLGAQGHIEASAIHALKG